VTSYEKKDRGYRAPSFLRIFRRQFAALFAFALPLGHEYVHRPSAFQRAAWSPIRPDDWRQSALSILCTQLARHPTECAFRAGNKDRRPFRAIAPLIPFHTPSNRPIREGIKSIQKFVSARCRNQHAGSVRSPDITSSRKLLRHSRRILSSFPALTRIPPGLLALAGLPVYLASSHAARFLCGYVFAYTSAPCSTNSRDFSSKPRSIASASVSPCSAAYFRTSSVIFMEQK